MILTHKIPPASPPASTLAPSRVGATTVTPSTIPRSTVPPSNTNNQVSTGSRAIPKPTWSQSTLLSPKEREDDDNKAFEAHMRSMKAEQTKKKDRPKLAPQMESKVSATDTEPDYITSNW